MIEPLESFLFLGLVGPFCTSWQWQNQLPIPTGIIFFLVFLYVGKKHGLFSKMVGKEVRCIQLSFNYGRQTDLLNILCSVGKNIR